MAARGFLHLLWILALFIPCFTADEDPDACYKVPFPVRAETDLVHVAVGSYTNIDIFPRMEKDNAISPIADMGKKYSLSWYFIQNKSLIDGSLFRSWDVSKYFKATIKPGYLGKGQKVARLKLVLDPNMMFALLDNYPGLGAEILGNLENTLSLAIGVEYDLSSDMRCELLSNGQEDIAGFTPIPEAPVRFIRLKVYVPLLRFAIYRVGQITISNAFQQASKTASQSSLGDNSNQISTGASSAGVYVVQRGETYTLQALASHSPSVGFEIEPKLTALVWDIDEMIEERSIAEVQKRPGGILLGGGAVLKYGPREHVTDTSSFFKITEEPLGDYARTWKGAETPLKTFNITVSEVAPPGHHYLIPYVVSYETRDTFLDIGVWPSIDSRCTYRDYGFNVIHIEVPDWDDGLPNGSLALLSVTLSLMVMSVISAAVILWMHKTGRLNDYGVEHFSIFTKLRARIRASKQRKLSVMRPDQRDKYRLMRENEYNFFERLLVGLHLKHVDVHYGQGSGASGSGVSSLSKRGPPGS